jgi:hypothetical protein
VLQMWHFMPESTHGAEEPLPDPQDILQGAARELGLDEGKKPSLFEGLPEEQVSPEEAPIFDGRYIAGACLEQIYNIVLRHTPPGAPILLSRGDVRWLHCESKSTVRKAWAQEKLPEPYPDFSMMHLVGDARRQIAHLSELKRFHETDVFDGALYVCEHVGYVIERALADAEPDPQYLGGDSGSKA